VTGLVAGFLTWRRWRARRGRIGHRWPWLARYLAGVCATTLIATIATTPLGAFQFHRFAVASLPANLVAVPVFAFWVMPALLIGTALLPFGLEAPAWRVAALGADLIFATADALTGWTGAVLQIGVVPEWGIALTVLGGLWWAIWQQGWRWAGAAAAAVGLAAPLFGAPPDLLVADRQLAVYAGDGQYWLRDRPDFVAGIWMRETGGRPQRWPAGPATGVDGRRLDCDAQACRLIAPGGRAALVFDPAASADCRDVAFAISRWPGGGCSRWPRRGETLAVWLRDGAADIASSRGGGRPWQAP
jgi:competence protein ComEC